MAAPLDPELDLGTTEHVPNRPLESGESLDWNRSPGVSAQPVQPQPASLPPPQPVQPTRTGPIPLVNPSGQVVGIDPAQAQQALAQGYRQPSAQELSFADQDTQFGTGGQALLAGTESALDTATLGGWSWAMRGLTHLAGGDAGQQEYMQEAKLRVQHNPVSSNIIGPIIGAVVPALVGDEAGGLSLAGRAGAMARAGVERALPEATTAASKILTSVAAQGVGSAVEGAFYGAGQVSREAALGDPNLTAQSAIAQIGLAGAIGGGLGSALGVLQASPAVIEDLGNRVLGKLSNARQGALEQLARAEVKPILEQGISPELRSSIADAWRSETARLGRQLTDQETKDIANSFSPGIADGLTDALYGRITGLADEAAARIKEVVNPLSTKDLISMSGIWALGGHVLRNLGLPGGSLAYGIAAVRLGQGLLTLVESPASKLVVLSGLERAAGTTQRALEIGAGVIARSAERVPGVGMAAAGLEREYAQDDVAARRLYQRRIENLQSLQGQQLFSTLDASVDGVREHAPDTAQAIQGAGARAVEFLQGKVPEQAPAGPLAPQPVPSRDQIDAFSRYYNAVNDPLSLLKQAAAGRLSPEAVEAVQMVYPQLYNRMAQEVLMAAGRRDPQAISPAARLMIGSLLGIDPDGSLAAMPGIQSAFALPPPRALVGGVIREATQLTLPNRFKTNTQAVAGRPVK